MTNKKEKILIIDGNAVIHRSFHAIPPTVTMKDGEPINAAYGFTSVLMKAIKEFSPEYVILTLDKKGPTFRNEIYKEYKATRKKQPDELYSQFARVKEIAKAFKIPVLEMSGYEADDLIGTITKLTGENIEDIIVTGDMDALQLVNESTKVYAMSRGVSESKIYDIEAVIEKHQFGPELVVDYKALRGDPGDNIPGVRGIGEKTATTLLLEFGTLEGVYANLDSEKIKPRIKNLLIEHKDDAFMSRDLATIKCDIEIEFDLDEVRFGNYDQEEVAELFSEFEFKSLLNRLQALSAGNASVKKADSDYADKFERNKSLFNYNLIDTETDFQNFLEKLKKQKSFTFDTETTGVNPLTCNLLGISFAWENDTAYYIDFRNSKTPQKQEDNLFNYQEKSSEDNSVNQAWIDAIKPILEDEKIGKNAHNAKYDMRVLQAQGIDVQGINFDTMIASYLMNPGTRQHGLDALTFTELNFEKINKEDLLGKGKDKLEFGEVEFDKMGIYSCEDADFTHKLQSKLDENLDKTALKKLFTEMEIPLIPVLSKMENDGIKLDSKFLEEMGADLSKKITKLEKNIHAEAGSDFNIKSTKQLKEVLFEKLEIPTEGLSKTKTGISTAADELEKIKDAHAIIPLIQEYRELTKIFSTYVDALPKLVNEKTGRVHSSFNQTVTATGRLSSTDPNLQNIPARTELGREIRKAFVAEKGYTLLALDYSQVELRLAAHLSGDKKMIEAFLNGDDIHSATAAEMNNVKIEDVTKQMRRDAKAINFGILYGQGSYGLSQAAEITQKEAKAFIEKYFETYPGVKEYLEKSIESARELGYSETLFGRKRYLPDLNSSIPMIKKSAERMAINTPLQGTSADIIKAVMITIYDDIISKQKDIEPEIKMLLQVHDELIFEVKEELIEKYSNQIKKIMEEVLDLKIPLLVDVAHGKNWGSLKE